MAHISHKLVYGVPVVALAIVGILVNVTDPSESVASILLVFLCIYVFLTSVIYIVLRSGRHLAQLVGLVREETKDTSLPPQRAYYVASALAFAPLCLLAMQSLSQIRVLDFVLVGALTGLVVFYIVKRT